MLLVAWFCLAVCCCFWISIALLLGRDFSYQPEGWGLAQRKLTTRASDEEDLKDRETEEAQDLPESETVFFCAEEEPARAEPARAEPARAEPPDCAPAEPDTDVGADHASHADADASQADAAPAEAAVPAPADAGDAASADAASADAASADAASADAASADADSADAEARLRAAIGLKEEGNAQVKAGDLVKACEFYNKALDMCPSRESGTSSILFSNLAYALNGREMYTEGLEAAEAAIELDSRNSKGYLRKFAAAKALGQIHEAHGALKSAIDLNPVLRTAYARELAELKARSEAKLEEDKAEMISKLKEFGSWALEKVGMKLDDFKVVQDPSTGSYNIQYNPTAGQPPS